MMRAHTFLQQKSTLIVHPRTPGFFFGCSHMLRVWNIDLHFGLNWWNIHVWSIWGCKHLSEDPRSSLATTWPSWRARQTSQSFSKLGTQWATLARRLDNYSFLLAQLEKILAQSPSNWIEFLFHDFRGPWETVKEIHLGECHIAPNNGNPSKKVRLYRYSSD